MNKFSYLLSVSALCLTTQATFAQCKDLRKQVDKFEGTVKIQSPLMKGPTYEPFTIIRRFEGQHSIYELRLMVRAVASATRQGAYLLLTDGSKLEWPEQAVTFDYRYGVRASSQFILSTEQLETLSKTPIAAIRLHVYDAELSRKDGERYRDYVTCILAADPAEVKEGLK